MSRFFIDRPIFAWVIAIVIMLVGLLAMRSLPIAQYPDIAPPAVQITTTYPGASAETVQNSVTQVIEQQLNGLDGLLYFSSNSTSAGTVTIVATFKPAPIPTSLRCRCRTRCRRRCPCCRRRCSSGRDGGQDAHQHADHRVGVRSHRRSYNSRDLADILVSNLQDPLSRVNGVGSDIVFGSQHAMRIWLDPFKLANFNLNPADVRAALLSQNAQVAAGQLGRVPNVADQQMNVTVTAQSQLQTPEQFRKVVIKSQPNGAAVTIGDVARVELGSENYDMSVRLNGHPASGIAMLLAPGANALTTADAVKARATQLAATLPPGVKLSFPVDNTKFIKISIHEVVKTLFEAIVLVVIVMFLFLQNWRATLVPAIAVPVVLLGTLGVLAALHYSINTLTLFAMVLVIGLLVDDAIVVVENVERIMAEEGLRPRRPRASRWTKSPERS